MQRQPDKECAGYLVSNIQVQVSFRGNSGEAGEQSENRAARALILASQKKELNTDIQQPGFAGGHPPNY
jgi:hypothetical protein